MTRFPLTLAAAVGRAVRQSATGPCIGCGNPLSLMVMGGGWFGRGRCEVPRQIMLCVRCYDKRDAERRRAKRRRPPPNQRACAQCGETFSPARSDARFCSTRCRVAAHRASAV